MPDACQSSPLPGKQHVYIWYHADTVLTATLRKWVEETGRRLDMPARLMVRYQAERTTFMEVYAVAEGMDTEKVLSAIEDSAAHQTWFAQLHSPRKAEIFAEVLAQDSSAAL